jgi:hypothetical protein
MEDSHRHCNTLTTGGGSIPPRPIFDVTELKNRAAGQWPQILADVGGIPAELLDGRHHSCPWCPDHGQDRFRLIDAQAGAVYCNQCFADNNGDGFAAIQKATGCDFFTALRMVADFLGNHHTNGPSNGYKSNGKAKVSDKGLVPIPESDWPAMLETYAKAKPPITAAGVRRCGGELVTWHDQRCIRLDGREPIDVNHLAAIVLCQVDGKPFPAIGKLIERKSHTVRGSVNSWLASGDVAAATTILDVEGVTDLLAAADKLPTDWVAVTNTNGCKARGKLSRTWAAGKRVIVAGDADEPGLDGQKRAAAAYHRDGAAEVSLGQLPYAIEKTHGRDLRDFLNDGGTIDKLPTAAVTIDLAAERNHKPRGPAPELEIEIGPDESRVVDEAIAALAPIDNIYQRGGSLVHVVDGADAPRGIARPKDAPRIAPVQHARLRELLADAATWYQPVNDEKRERKHPPDWAVKAIDARGQWRGIRRLEAVVESPVLRADGTIMQRPGYDEATGLVFRPSQEFPPAAEKPTRAQAVAAANKLLEVVQDFPFASDAHRAAWLAATLTPLARYAFHGCAPLFLIDANVRGCGKSLLADATSQIVAGREMARMSLPRDDDEFRKRITALAVAGESLILIDNIVGTFGSASLDAALTATAWSDRILGQTAIASGVPLFSTWFATGNNIVLAADTARRALHIRLESPEENPEERSGFHHADLLAWVRRNRARLSVDAVTILAGYFAAGRPDMQLKPWGSFEAWSAIVRQAIVWAGLPDPAATRTELTSQADREAVALRQLLGGWPEIDPAGNGVTVADMLTLLAENPAAYSTIRAALWELCPPKDGKTLNPRAVGMKLHHLRRRVVDGRFLDRRDARAGAIWRIGQPETCGTSTTSGTKSSPPAHAHTHAHAHEKPASTGSSPASPVSPADCHHGDVEESKTFDGYINRRCRSCGADLPCRKATEAPLGDCGLEPLQFSAGKR